MPGNPNSGTRTYGMAERANVLEFPESPSHRPPAKNLHVSNALASITNIASTYGGYPWGRRKTPWINARESGLAQSGSHSETNASTSSHEISVLTAATFILITTISIVDSGRTAINPGTARSPDQKSGLENALPIPKARTIGVMNVAARIRRESPASCRMYQESGPTTIASKTPTNSGNTE